MAGALIFEGFAGCKPGFEAVLPVTAQVEDDHGGELSSLREAWIEGEGVRIANTAAVRRGIVSESTPAVNAMKSDADMLSIQLHKQARGCLQKCSPFSFDPRYSFFFPAF